MSRVLNTRSMRVYVRQSGHFDIGFIKLCAQQFDMDKKGALRHHELLHKCPVGYIYKCRTLLHSEEYKRYEFAHQYIFGGDDCYGDDGELLTDFVNVFVTAPETPIVPPSYSALDNVPEDKVVQVCWGSLATTIEYGTAKRISGSWFIYGQSNPHANGQPCTTPTAWIKE